MTGSAERSPSTRLRAMLARAAPRHHDKPLRGVVASDAAPPWRTGWVLAGAVAGTALQLQQPALWPLPAYLAWGLLAPLVWWVAGQRGARALARLAWLVAGCALAFGLTGVRAVVYQSQGLPPALEGRDIAVVGRVASLPHTGPTGERFEFVVEQARLDGAAVRLPHRLLLGWYRAASTPEGQAAPARRLVAGERWAFEVRLKRPHGSVNPHGFDRERWLWEQGIGATGHVRLGPRARVPQPLGMTPWHPVERSRQAIAQAIAQRVESPRAAGVLAALVVGEQAAIVGRGKRVVRYGFLSNQPLSQFGGADFENKSFALPKRCNAPAGKKVVRFRVLAAQSLQTCFRSREMLDTGRYTS